MVGPHLVGVQAVIALMLALSLGQSSECAALKATDSRVLCAKVERISDNVLKMGTRQGEIHTRVSVLESKVEDIRSQRLADMGGTGLIIAALNITVGILTRKKWGQNGGPK